MFPPEGRQVKNKKQKCVQGCDQKSLGNYSRPVKSTNNSIKKTFLSIKSQEPIN